MNKDKSGAAAGVLIVLLALAFLAPPMSAQKDFKMGENRIIERFKRANPLFLDGTAQFNKGNLDKAEKKLLEALEIMPEHADAAYVMAKIHLQRKEFFKALDSIDAAVKNYAYIAQFQTFTRQQYFDNLRQQKQQTEEQRSQLLGTLASIPANDADTQKRENLERSIQINEKTLQSIETRLTAPVPEIDEIPADYYFIRGNVLFKLGMPADAAKQYGEAIRIDPNHGNALNNLALVLFSQKQYPEALDCLLKAEAAGTPINPDFKKAIEEKIPR